MPLWGTNLFMATGPGQTPGSANSDRPLAIALGVINNAIGSNSNLMSVTQSGTPTFNYPGGQAGNIVAQRGCAVRELLRVQQRAGKLDDHLLQQQSHHGRVSYFDRSGCAYWSGQRDHLPRAGQRHHRP